MISVIQAEIMENKKILPHYFQLILKCPQIAQAAEPGQFVMISVSNTLDPLLKRPISINRINKDQGTITLIYQLLGKGTKLLSQITSGTLEIMGPLGKGFSWAEDTKIAAVVGGGCGIAPLLALTERLVKEGKEVFVMLGAQSREKLLNLEEFSKITSNVAIATDDGSLGIKGFVTHLLSQLLENNQVDQVYCCGPTAMTKNVIKVTKENFIPCQVSLEERMACGVGACLGCVVKVRSEDGIITYQRVCHDGPVFASSEVVIDE